MDSFTELKQENLLLKTEIDILKKDNQKYKSKISTLTIQNEILNEESNNKILLLNNEIEILKSNIQEYEKKVKQHEITKQNEIKKNDTISKMQIFIKTLSGKTIAIYVNSSDSIDNIKKHISDKEGIPIDQQRLVWNGMELERGIVVSNGICDGAIISMILRLRGGY